MAPANRRTFLTDVGRGMLATGLGVSLAHDLGVSITFADEGTASIPPGRSDADHSGRKSSADVGGQDSEG